MILVTTSSVELYKKRKKGKKGKIEPKQRVRTEIKL